jgi:hypothetical protein
MSEPTRLVIGSVEVPTPADVREAARAATTPLVWILDAGAEALPEALAPLLAAATAPAVSLPVDEAGAPVERLIGRYADEDDDEVVDAVATRRVPLRHTHLVSLVVERELVLALDPPDVARFGPYAGPEWTARLFDRRRGFLVPASRVQVTESPPAAALPALRVMRTGAWRRGETVREVVRALRSPPARG